MKKTILVSALALAVAAGAGAKTADELRVYINPGHGSWTANDRPCTLVDHGAYSRTNTDTLSFFESNTNLRKGFGVLERLRSYGLKFDATLNQTGDRDKIGAARDMSNNIVMSHVKCGPYHEDNGTESQLGEATPSDIYAYNRNLSEICAEVEANNFDMFISIHSNAATEGTSTNYPLFLYRGYDTPKAEDGVTAEHQTISRAMADAAWDYVYANKMNQWTAYASSKNLRGDCNFYGSSSIGGLGYKGYLGVLKHGTPGFLSEGYFHTYQPARHRYMNFDVCYVEGSAYAHGVADYFGLDKADKNLGTIMGDVRDQYEKFKDAAYTPNPTTADAYKPVNGAKVVLKKDGVQVAEYTTDNYYNGVYVFRDVEAGKYTIEASAEGYLASEPVEVEVKGLGLVQPQIQIVSESWTPPTIVYENYPDPVDIKGVYAADEYTLDAEIDNEPVEALAGKTVRRTIARNGKLYILALDEAQEPTIVVYNTADKTATQVSTEGIQGQIKKVADIQLTADGVLVACNKEINMYDDNQVEAGEIRGTLRVYKWTNDENGNPAGAPEEWFTSRLSANMYRAYVGESMAYNGTLADGKILVTASNWWDNKRVWFNQYTIVDGAMIMQGFNNKPDAWFNEANVGTDYTISTCPGDDDAFIITSSKIAPTKAEWDLAQDLTRLADGVADGATGAGYFRYAGHNYMTVADNEGVALVDIKGYADAAAVKLNVNKAAATAEGEEETPAVALGATAGEGQAIKNAEETTTGVYIDLYAVRDGKISKLTTKGVDAAAGIVPMAYGLKSQAADNDTYTVSYALTAAAKDASLVLTPAEGDVVKIALGDLEAGEHTYTLDATELVENMNYTWAIEVAGKTIPQSGLVKYENSDLTARGGVVAITEPEYDSFGYVVVGHGKNNGYDIYNPAGEKVGARVWKNHATMGVGTTNQSNPIRGNEIRGMAAFGGWGDDAEGVVYMNPIDQTQEPQTMFAGVMQSSGAHLYEGVNTGGGTSAVEFGGKGADTKMYLFSEDHVGTSNSITVSTLGDAWQVTTAPEQIGYSGRLANTNVDLLTLGDHYLIASQVRGAGNNSYGCPGFLIVDLNDNSEAFNSQSLDPSQEVYNGNLNAVNSGVAVSVDNKRLAVYEVSRILVYDVDLSGAKPVLTFAYDFPAKTCNWAHMRFDYAGNLHVYNRDGKGYYVYALAQENPVVSTPAKAEFAIKGGSSAVENIIADEAVEAGAAVYYNLNGVQVSGESLIPGVYVKVAGGKATKVVVK